MGPEGWFAVMIKRRKRGELPDGQNIAPPVCALGCGGVAQGQLSVNWHPFGQWDDELPRSQRDQRAAQAIQFYLPCCATCARGAVKVSVSIPDQKGGSRS